MKKLHVEFDYTVHMEKDVIIPELDLPYDKLREIAVESIKEIYGSDENISNLKITEKS